MLYNITLLTLIKNDETTPNPNINDGATWYRPLSSSCVERTANTKSKVRIPSNTHPDPAETLSLGKISPSFSVRSFNVRSRVTPAIPVFIGLNKLLI